MAKFILSYILFFVTLFRSANAAYNVVNFGAKPDGKTDSTQPFLRAWSSACNSIRPTTVYVPRGNFLIRAVVFSGPCTSRITFKIDGTLLAPSNYWDLGNYGYWIMFSKVNRVSVYGGTIDAKGASFWACRKSGNNCGVGARSISFSWSRNIVIRGLTSINSQQIHISVDHCDNFVIRNVKIRAPSDSPNTDGIHVQYSTGVTITSSTIMTGDDCISIGQGSKNFWIERIGCGPGHGISIGSLGDNANEDGVQNVTVTSSVFTKTENGVRIKTWASPSNGFARNIVFRNLIMKEVNNPIYIDQNYCPDNRGCLHQQSSGIKISGVTYKNIKGTSATQVAMNFDCSSSNPCKGIKLQDIKLTYLNRPATSYCKNAGGSSSGVVVPRSCF